VVGDDGVVRVSGADVEGFGDKEGWLCGRAERGKEKGFREGYAKRLCFNLQRGVMGRTPWCKNYTFVPTLCFWEKVEEKGVVDAAGLPCLVALVQYAGQFVQGGQRWSKLVKATSMG
jgi:hypothetical protein